MKTIRKLIVTGSAILALTAGSITAFAASQYMTPAEAVAGLTGREVQSVIDERAQGGKYYGTIAKEAGVLDEFQAEMLEIKKETLAARVADGTMDQDLANDIIARLETNQANCDGSGTGIGLGTGFGRGGGLGSGQGDLGMRNGLHSGACRYQ